MPYLHGFLRVREVFVGIVVVDFEHLPINKQSQLLRLSGLNGGPGRTRTSNQTVMSDAPISDDPEKSDT